MGLLAGFARHRMSCEGSWDFFDRFRRATDAEAVRPGPMPHDDRGPAARVGRTTPEVARRPEQVAADHAVELDRLTVELAAQAEHLAAAMAPELDRIAAAIKAEDVRAAA